MIETQEKQNPIQEQLKKEIRVAEFIGEFKEREKQREIPLKTK